MKKTLALLALVFLLWNNTFSQEWETICNYNYNDDTNGICQEYSSEDCQYFSDNKCYSATNGYYNSIHSEIGKSKSCENGNICIEYNEIKYDYRCKAYARR